MTITQKELQRGISSYTVSNGRVSFTAMNYGCCLMQILVPNKLGGFTDILQGYDTLDGWKADDSSHNCVVGRFANRIAGARFTLDGETYALDANDGENSLHGGYTRWEKIVWNAEAFDDGEAAGVRFTRTSPDGEQGYPGTVAATVTYALDGKDALTLTYTATSDKATPINLTNHAYFNLNGGGTILDHVLQLDCGSILEVNGALIPTGRLLDVIDEATTFNFRKPRTMNIGGYDHCFVTRAANAKRKPCTNDEDEMGLRIDDRWQHVTVTADESKVVRVGTVSSPLTGITMEISTNQPGMQVYSGNFLKGAVGKGGQRYEKHTGICFETQRFPDAPNKPDFPSCILRPGEEYKAVTVYAFSTAE